MVSFLGGSGFIRDLGGSCFKWCPCKTVLESLLCRSAQIRTLGMVQYVTANSPLVPLHFILKVQLRWYIISQEKLDWNRTEGLKWTDITEELCSHWGNWKWQMIFQSNKIPTNFIYLKASGRFVLLWRIKVEHHSLFHWLNIYQRVNQWSRKKTTDREHVY